MQDSGEHRPGPAGPSRENGQEGPAGWNFPKPEFIPAPTYWPFVLSFGGTLIGLGVLTSKLIAGTGAVLFIIAVVKWAGELLHEERG